MLAGVPLLFVHCADDAGPTDSPDRPQVDAALFAEDTGEPALDGGPSREPDAGRDAGSVDAEPPPEPRRCGSADAQALEVRSLAPRETDEAIRMGDPVHRYVPAVGAPTGRLLVFLPGATAEPADYDDVLKNAAAAGDDALGLAYVNDIRIFVVCGNDQTPSCQEDIRIEVLRGDDRSPHVDVGPADSILNRLVKLLQSLGWTQYLDGNAPRWSSIAVAGHSQGSGHAAMIGRFFEAERVLLFAGTEPAPWTQQPRRTPAERTWGFGHVDDPLFRAFPRSWDNLGIPGAPTSVDDAAPPYGGSHQLTSSAPPNPDDDNAHRSPIGDTATPRDAEGRSLYAPTWCHMLGHPR